MPLLGEFALTFLGCDGAGCETNYDIGSDRQTVVIKVDNNGGWCDPAPCQYSYFYRVEEAGKVIVPKTFIGYYPSFTTFIFYAENKSLVALVGDIEEYENSEIVFIHDFKSGYSGNSRNLTPEWNSAKERLLKENPKLEEQIK